MQCVDEFFQHLHSFMTHNSAYRYSTNSCSPWFIMSALLAGNCRRPADWCARSCSNWWCAAQHRVVTLATGCRKACNVLCDFQPEDHCSYALKFLRIRVPEHSLVCAHGLRWRFGAAKKEVKPTRAAVHSARHSKLPPPCNKASTGKGENDDKDCGALALVASQTEQRAAY